MVDNTNILGHYYEITSILGFLTIQWQENSTDFPVRKFLNKPTDDQTPFHCEVYFINKT